MRSPLVDLSLIHGKKWFQNILILPLIKTANSVFLQITYDGPMMLFLAKSNFK